MFINVSKFKVANIFCHHDAPKFEFLRTRCEPPGGGLTMKSDVIWRAGVLLVTGMALE